MTHTSNTYPLIVNWCLSCVIALFIATPVFANSIESQRKDYVAAKKALFKKQYKTFSKIADSLTDYPLYPYLRYQYLRQQLWLVKDDEVIDFLTQYDDLPVTNGLRVSWLKLLAKRQHWDTFLEHYTQQADPLLQCYQLKARMKTDNNTLLLEDIRSVWLTGKSLPPQCDPAFKLLYDSDLMTNELVWMRIRLAMHNNKLGLARYLARRLDKAHQQLANQWFKLHDNPYRHTRKLSLQDNEKTTEVISYAILRLAKQDVAKATKRFNALAEDYTFTETERAEISRTLALTAAKRRHKLATVLLDKVASADVDETIMYYRLKTALAKEDWMLLRKWTTGKPTDSDIDLQWRYWQARALAETGDLEQANKIYALLAKERDYYGFLAADKMGLPYSMNHFPLPENRAEIAELESLPAIQRTYEFYQLGMKSSANRELYHALGKMTVYQMQQVAAITAQWGWHDRAIFILGRAESYDDLVLRFPVLFDALISKHANKQALDISWMYALIRAESAFIEHIKSPAGALGLMQVMPKTGKMVARNIGLNRFTKHQLTQAKTNVAIGSVYMKNMLDKFGGNIALASAAYNAGPHRVSRWLPKKHCLIPELWVEQIPFKETRKYVRRVLTYANIYDWRLNQDITPIKKRMRFTAVNNKKWARLICPAQ